MGRALAREHPVEADLVCGVPDSGLEAAMGYALESGIPLRQRLCEKTAIWAGASSSPTQAQREHAVDLKLNPLRAAVEGKRVVLVDDSIVRGTTCGKIVSNLRRAGAREVHLRISSPPFTHTCYFGTDIGDEENLIANRLSLSELQARTGATPWGTSAWRDYRRPAGAAACPCAAAALPGSTPPRRNPPAKASLNNRSLRLS